MIMVVDGQGGGLGRQLVEQLRRELPDVDILAAGTNVMATAAMLKSGADHGATGENAIIVNARRAEVIMGPIGIIVANALLGELSPDMAEAIAMSDALKVLVPVGKCHVKIAGAQDTPLQAALEDAIKLAKQYMSSK